MLKRFLVLACTLVLFVTAFFLHQWWVDARMEHGFRVEREKFGVEGQDLVTANPPTTEPLTPTPPPLPVMAAPIEETTVPAAGFGTPAGTNAPAEVPLDSNTLIGPVPPASTTPADSNAPGNPEPPSTNATPDSTMVLPAVRQLSTALLASLRVQDTGAAPAAPAAPTPIPAKPASAPEPAAPVAARAAAANAGTATNTASVPPAPRRAEPVSEVHTAGSSANVIILGYHQFTPPGVRAGGKFIYTMPQDVFEYEMKYLSDNHYNVVPLSDVVAFAERKKDLPNNTVAITIDDGYKSAIVYAAPILKKYNFPWTFFVYPSFITRTESKGAASWPDLVELQKEGVDIECHSMTHPNLKSMTQKWPPNSRYSHRLTPEEYDAFLTDEIVNSKAKIEQKLNKTVKFFAYPYGNYNSEVQAKAIGAGYEAIFTVAGNPIHPGTPVYSMGRYIITTPVEKSYVAYLHEHALWLNNITPPPGATVSDPRPLITADLGYSGRINPASIVADVSTMGEVKYDFDPKALALRLYLPRDLIAPVEKINIYAKDAENGRTLVSSWSFNYQPTATGVAHAPIGAGVRKDSAHEETAEPASTNEPAAASNAAPEAPAGMARRPVQRALLPPPGPAMPAIEAAPAPSVMSAVPAADSNATPAPPAEAATPAEPATTNAASDAR